MEKKIQNHAVKLVKAIFIYHSMFQVLGGLNHYILRYCVHRQTHTQRHTHTDTHTDGHEYSVVAVDKPPWPSP